MRDWMRKLYRMLFVEHFVRTWFLLACIVLMGFFNQPLALFNAFLLEALSLLAIWGSDFNGEG